MLTLIGVVLSQSKVRLTACPDKTMQDRKEPMCYIRFRESGGDYTLKNEFWAKMYGDNALRVFKPGQKVEVELSFHVHKNSHKCSQRVTVNKISLVQDKKRYLWDDFKAPWED